MSDNKPQNKPDHAFILAAGQGKRLRPYTDTMPKPMVPVNGRPIIDYTVEKLLREGIKNITINLFYLGDRIENYFSGRQDCNFYFSKETALLDTGGGIKAALPSMGNNPFYIINGDAFWSDPAGETSLNALAEMWRPDDMDILLLLQPVKTMTLTQGVGDYDLDAQGRAVRARDKNGQYMFAGIRIAKPDIFAESPKGAFSFLELMDKAEAQGRLYGHVHQGEWHHISTPEDLERVNQALGAARPTEHARTA
jgi:MurNAc alpha-1-phosphate uridylyltransferase